MKIDKIHAEFHHLLYQYIAARIKDRDDAADTLQEVFIKIASKLDSLADGAKLKSWIYTITRNTIIDYYRKKPGANKTDLTDKIADETIAEADIDMTKGLDKCL